MTANSPAFPSCNRAITGTPDPLQQFLNTAPALAGDIARHINECLETDQPGIALATTLSFIATLRSGRITNEWKIPPNIYTIAIAPTGIGKTRAQQVIVDICTRANLSHLLMGRPASDAGILKGLSRMPRQFLIWDEFGLALTEISKSQSSYRTAIIPCLMDLFSAAGRRYIGKEYAEKDRVDITNPYLSLCAGSTPKRYFSALDSHMIEDGFLPRFLVFEGVSSVKFKPIGEIELPLEIVARVARMDKGRKNPNPKGNLDTSPLLQPLMFEDSEMVEIVQEQRRCWLESEPADINRAFWARSFEYWVKLCMILSDDDTCYVSNKVASYSWKLTEYLVTNIIERCTKEVHDTVGERTSANRTQKFVNLLKLGETIECRSFSKRAFNNGFSGKERKERLADLLEQGVLLESTVFNESTCRKNSVYTRHV